MNTQKRDFDKEAATWDEQPARVKLAEDVAHTIEQQVTLGPGMDVLDFGCGTGLLTLKFAPRVKSITGADSSQGMLDVLKAKASKQGRTNVVVELLSPSHGPSGLHDVIVSNMTFHHVEHTDALLAQLFQCVKATGYLCVADLDLDQGEFHDDNTGVFHFGFDRAALRQSFAQAGFSEVKDVTAAEVVKKTRKGDPRKFTVFLMIGKKVAR